MVQVFTLRLSYEAFGRFRKKNDLIRQRLHKIEEKRGQEHLHKILRQVDPESAQKISTRDAYRVKRALEIYFQTGQKKSTIQPKTERFQSAKFFLDLSAAELRQRIELRTETFLNNGWIEEVHELMSRYRDFEQMPAAASLGYREIIQHLRGGLSLDECKTLINHKTWQYARRQRTWFRNQDQFTSVDSSSELQKKVDSVLQ